MQETAAGVELAPNEAILQGAAKPLNQVFIFVGHLPSALPTRQIHCRLAAETALVVASQSLSSGQCSHYSRMESLSTPMCSLITWQNSMMSFFDYVAELNDERDVSIRRPYCPAVFNDQCGRVIYLLSNAVVFPRRS